MRNGALVRILKMAERLRGGRCAIDDLARDFHVTTRTVRRDLDVLSVVGAQVHRFEGVYWIDERTLGRTNDAARIASPEREHR